MFRISSKTAFLYVKNACWKLEDFQKWVSKIKRDKREDARKLAESILLNAEQPRFGPFLVAREKPVDSAEAIKLAKLVLGRE